MNDELPKATKVNRTLDERFRHRPEVYARLQKLADFMDQAIAEGCTADEAEARAREQLDRLGQELLTGWAQEQQTESLARAQRQHPQASKHVKKK